MIESLLHKEESSLILFCIGEKSVPQIACLLSEVNKYTAALAWVIAQHFIEKGSNFNRNFLQEGELSAEIDDVPSRLA